MLKVHLKTGATLCFDLEQESDLQRWLEQASDTAVQDSISGLTVQENGVMYSVSRPEGFESLFMLAENIPAIGRAKGGTKVLIRASDLEIGFTGHRSQRAGRIDIARTGWSRFNGKNR